ncbi:hypothetical protein HK098_001377 [Nowakowskiella sp. JEL0407]|nr:hypothetical protein HK098_001377 [Nowakowskiella sp. JEL0407]
MEDFFVSFFESDCSVSTEFSNSINPDSIFNDQWVGEDDKAKDDIPWTEEELDSLTVCEDSEVEVVEDINEVQDGGVDHIFANLDMENLNEDDCDYIGQSIDEFGKFILSQTLAAHTNFKQACLDFENASHKIIEIEQNQSGLELEIKQVEEKYKKLELEKECSLKELHSAQSEMYRIEAEIEELVSQQTTLVEHLKQISLQKAESEDYYQTLERHAAELETHLTKVRKEMAAMAEMMKTVDAEISKEEQEMTSANDAVVVGLKSLREMESNRNEIIRRIEEEKGLLNAAMAEMNALRKMQNWIDFGNLVCGTAVVIGIATALISPLGGAILTCIAAGYKSFSSEMTRRMVLRERHLQDTIQSYKLNISRRQQQLNDITEKSLTLAKDYRENITIRNQKRKLVEGLRAKAALLKTSFAMGGKKETFLSLRLDITKNKSLQHSERISEYNQTIGKIKDKIGVKCSEKEKKKQSLKRLEGEVIVVEQRLQSSVRHSEKLTKQRGEFRSQLFKESYLFQTQKHILEAREIALKDVREACIQVKRVVKENMKEIHNVALRKNFRKY